MAKPDPNTVKMAMELASTDAGKALIAQLQANHKDAMDAAMRQAAAGNYEGLRQTLSTAMDSPEVKAMLESLRRQQNG